MVPIIGITAGGSFSEYRLNTRYSEAVKNAGGAPIILTGCTKDILHICDGVLLSGGGDISPTLCGIEEYDPVYLEAPDPIRDRFELELAKLTFEYGIPTLGICRGLQVMNTALGGTVLFHINGHMQKADRDQPSHRISITAGSILKKLILHEHIEVNSFHHQSLNAVSPMLSVCATADDGVTEAAQADGHPFYLGVQWHPEHMEGHSSDVLFAALCAAAKRMKGQSL